MTRLDFMFFVSGRGQVVGCFSSEEMIYYSVGVFWGRVEDEKNYYDDAIVRGV